MADLYSRYTSGTQFSAGTMVGSSSGASGLNPIVDRLNSMTYRTIGSTITATTSTLVGSLVFNNYISGDVVDFEVTAMANAGGTDGVVGVEVSGINIAAGGGLLFPLSGCHKYVVGRGAIVDEINTNLRVEGTYTTATDTITLGSQFAVFGLGDPYLTGSGTIVLKLSSAKPTDSAHYKVNLKAQHHRVTSP